MRAEAAAVKTRLSADSILSGKVYDSVRVSEGGDAVRANYVVVSFSVPEEETARFSAVTYADADREVVFNVQCVAVDADGVMLLVERAKAQLLGYMLTVAGRTCTPIRRLPDVEEGEIRYDRSARLFYVHMSFAFWSKRP